MFDDSESFNTVRCIVLERQRENPEASRRLEIFQNLLIYISCPSYVLPSTQDSLLLTLGPFLVIVCLLVSLTLGAGFVLFVMYQHPQKLPSRQKGAQ